MSAPRMTVEEWEAAEWDALCGGGRGAIETALLEARRARESEKAALDVLEGIRDSADDGRSGPEWLSERLDEVRDLLKKAGRR